MTVSQIASILTAKQGGSFYSVKVNRPGKVRKGVADNITKVSVFQGMLAEYSNRKPVKDAVVAGERDAPMMPVWAESIEIEGMRFWRNVKNGNLYLPVCVTGNPSKAQWYRNGEQVNLDDVKDALLASEYATKPSKEETEEKGQALFVAVSVENIESIA